MEIEPAGKALRRARRSVCRDAKIPCLQSSGARQASKARSGIWQADRSGAALLMGALILLVFVVVDFAANEKQYRDLAGQSDRAHAIIDAAQDALSALKDAETGQRGFLITMKPAYLEPYNSGARAWPHEISELKRLTSGDAALSRLVSGMSEDGDLKIRGLQRTIEQAQAGKRDQAIAAVDMGRGKQRMDMIRGIAGEIVAREEAEFARFARLALESEMHTRWSVEAAAAALFLLTLTGTMLLWREIARERLLAEDLEKSEARYRTLAESLEEQVQARTRELQNLNEELQAFTYSVSHDLRAPLRAIDGFSSILVEDYGEKLDEGAHELLGRIRRGVRRMSQLIQSLLDLSRATRGELKKQRVGISDLAASVIEGLRQANPERRVDVSIEPGLMVEGDPNLIRIVLENLLSNAWKFSSRREMARIEFAAASQNGLREFFVRDNGAGFDAAQAGRLFKPFQRLHSESEFEGSGIGLATALRIVRRHGGSIRAESSKNGGATFYFSI